jgi:hypothetical protein
MKNNPIELDHFVTKGHNFPTTPKQAATYDLGNNNPSLDSNAYTIFFQAFLLFRQFAVSNHSFRWLWWGRRW